jgi:hypothetical protein
MRAIRGVISWWRARRQRDAVEHAPWRIVERNKNDAITLYAVRPGEDDMRLSLPIETQGPAFSSAIEEARAEAREKLVALNNRDR